MHDAADVTRLLSGGWISRQPEGFRHALLDILVWREVAVGTTINHAGDDNGGIWGLARGQIDLSTALSTADSPVADIHLPGRWGGTGPIFGRRRAADGIARTPSLIASTSLPMLQSLVRHNPQWWECIGQLAIEYAFRYGGALGDLLIRDTRRRCIAVLLRLADCRHVDPATPPTIVLTQSDLATAANTSRLPVGELLGDLQAAGYIALRYRRIVILDAASLRAIIDS